MDPELNPTPAPLSELPSSEPITLEVLPPQAPPPPPRLRHAHTLANLFHVFIQSRGALAKNTILEWKCISRRFCKYFAHRKLTPQTMVEWVEYLRSIRTDEKFPKSLNARHINSINRRLRGFLRWLKRMRYINDDLAECIPTLITEAPPSPRMITEAEYEAIKAYCKGNERWQTQLWLIILGYRTGMSLADCCHLRWEQVHYSDTGPSFIDIRRMKMKRHGDAARCLIPIIPGSDLDDWLRKLMTVPRWKRHDGVNDYVHQEAEALFHVIHRFSTLQRNFQQIFQTVGIPKGKTFKCLRNSMASNLINSGMPIPLVCKITGHRDVNTLTGYLKPDERALEEGMFKAQQYSAATLPSQQTDNGLVKLEDEEKPAAPDEHEDDDDDED